RFSLNSYKNKKFELRALPQYLNEKQNLIINSFSLKDAKNIIYKNCVYEPPIKEDLRQIRLNIFLDGK
ncbi:MAG: hypothetical protein ACXVCA_05525, partial [Bdellovibrio sp.]